MKIEILPEEHIKTSVKEFNADTEQMKSCRTNAIRRKCQRPGVYAFWDRYKCLYVGKSSVNVGGRILSHIRKNNPIHHIGDFLDENMNLEIWLCSKFESNILEHIIINDLSPRLNISL